MLTFILKGRFGPILPDSALLFSHDARHRVSKSALIRLKSNSNLFLHSECQHALEKEVLATVAEFIRYEVLGYAIGGDTTYYEAILEYKETSGNHVKVEQAVVSRWRDDTIITERFYHA